MILRYVSGQLESSKYKAVGPMSSSTSASLSQVPYSIRSQNDAVPEVNRNMAAKLSTAVCYAQLSSHIASGAAACGYRLQRRTIQVHSLCYRFEVPPAAWLANENQVFLAGAVDIWNSNQHRVSGQLDFGLLVYKSFGSYRANLTVNSVFDSRAINVSPK